MIISLKTFYQFLVSLAILASSYSFLKPGISPPEYPVSKVNAALQRLDPNLVSSRERDLKSDSSDRKISKLYQYTFNDGSELLSLVVRLRKKDEFKIEAYGQLTKNLDPIYMKNPVFKSDIPRSMYGVINGLTYYQTCLVPGSTSLDQVDVRLYPLTSVVESLVHRRKDIMTRMLGSNARFDYSCLVLSYKPPAFKQESEAIKIWSMILSNIQVALRN